MTYLEQRPLISLLTLATIWFLLSPLSSANYGQDFLLAFPGTDQPNSTANVYITPFNTNTSVYAKLSGVVIGNLTVPASGFRTIRPQLSGTPLAIRMETNDTVVIYVSLVFGSDLFSTGIYLASPIEQLSTIFTAFTHCGYGNCVLLMATFYDDVEVSFTFRLTPSSALVRFGGGTYTDSSTLFFSLQSMIVKQMDSGSVDVTGSQITSSDPIVVVGGGDLSLFTNSTKTDLLIEQVPPQNLLGTQFILVNMATSGKTVTVIKIAYTETNTTLCVNSTELKILANNTLWQKYSFTNDYMATVISSNKPVIVEMIYENTTTASWPNYVFTSIKSGNAASVVILPVTKWTSNCVTVIGVGSFTIVSTSVCKDNITLNTQTITSMTSWSQVSVYPEYFYAKVSVSSKNLTRFVVQGLNDCTFTGYVSFENGVGLTAFPLGWDNLIPVLPVVNPKIFLTRRCALPLLAASTIVTQQTTSATSQSDQLNTQDSESTLEVDQTTNTSWTSSYDISSSNIDYQSTNVEAATTSLLNEPIEDLPSSQVLEVNTYTSSSPESNTETNTSYKTSAYTPINSNKSVETVTASTTTTTEKGLYFHITTDTSSTITTVTDKMTNNDDGTNFTIMDSSIPNQCACNCRTKLLSNMTINSPSFLRSLDEQQKELIVKKTVLTAYISDKISLDNVEQSSSFYGSTIGLFVIVVIFGFLFLSDLTNLCCLKSAASIYNNKA